MHWKHRSDMKMRECCVEDERQDLCWPLMYKVVKELHVNRCAVILTGSNCSCSPCHNLAPHNIANASG